MSRHVEPLFADSTGEVRNIPAGADFLGQLARGLYDALADQTDPGALSEAVIYLPNRRSARALESSFFQISGQSALMLPTIRTLGDLDAEDPFAMFGAKIDHLPPAMSTSARLGHLAKLVSAFQSARGTSVSPANALLGATELASLLDQVALAENVDWTRLSTLIDDADMAQHWEDSAVFLSIILEQWPSFLAEAEMSDPAVFQRALAEALAASWTERKPRTPVIIAGSTGATAGTRSLMKAVLQLPKGLIVLPGLDDQTSDVEISAIRNAPTHPQHVLRRTIDDLGIPHQGVQLWPGARSDARRESRRKLMQEALAPAELTASWGQRSAELADPQSARVFIETATDGLALIEADTETEEAELAALMLREGLERPGERTALVTLDMGLAMRVSAHLNAMGVACDPSAGIPLLQTRLGAALMQLTELMADPSDPVNVLAALKLELSRFDSESVSALDRHIMRGPRLWRRWADLRQHALKTLERPRCKATSNEAAQITSLIETLIPILGPLESSVERRAPQLPGEIIEQLSTLLLQWVGDEVISDGQDSALATQRLFELREIIEPLGPISVQSFADILRQDFLSTAAPPRFEHPNISIWGPLEARLQTADHIILAGLNEEHWPVQPSSDSLLSRKFRHSVGLADLDERIGLSAHDFAQLASTTKTTLLTARRRDGKPAVASRWIWRLRMLIRGAAENGEAEDFLKPGKDRNPKVWLAAKRQSEKFEPSLTRPEPRPPLTARPSQLSVTRIETLIRDPYAVYCDQILGLTRLDAPGIYPDARHVGTAIHSALEWFEKEGAGWDETRLLAELETALRASGVPQLEIVALRERRRAVVREFLTWRHEDGNEPDERVGTEVRGTIQLDSETGSVRLVGIADRIQKRADGTLRIFDYKTGSPPSLAQVQSGLSPQMPLLAYIAKCGGFGEPGDTGIVVSDLAFIRFGTRFETRHLGSPSDIEELIEATVEGVHKLLESYADPSQPYLSAPRPHRLSYPSEYARLARRDEWVDHASYD